MRMRMRLTCCAAIVCVLIGCGSDEPETPASSWRTVRSEQMSQKQKLQRDIAEDAVRAMGTQLNERLIEAIGQHGPAGAINVCKLEAPPIAAGVERTEQLDIGRTSFKLRNPNNAPPDFAVPVVAQRIDEKTYMTDPRGRLAAMMPIHTGALCLNCHGPRDQLVAPVASTLRELYPQDEAVGFKLNDLRGWFWVIVPPQKVSG